jgi:hypothetical protein
VARPSGFSILCRRRVREILIDSVQDEYGSAGPINSTATCRRAPLRPPRVRHHRGNRRPRWPEYALRVAGAIPSLFSSGCFAHVQSWQSQAELAAKIRAELPGSGSPNCSSNWQHGEFAHAVSILCCCADAGLAEQPVAKEDHERIVGQAVRVDQIEGVVRIGALREWRNQASRLEIVCDQR